MKEWAPPDGGYGWVVMALCSAMMSIVVHSICTFGLYMPELIDYFDASSTEVAWIGSLNMASGSFIGLIIGGFVDQYGCPIVISVGSLLMLTGAVLSSVYRHLETMYFAYGLILSIGGACLYNCSYVATHMYFTTKRTFATCLVSMGMSVGAFVWPPITQYLIDQYEWHGAILIFGAVYLHGIPIALLLKSPQTQGNTQRNSLTERCRSQCDVSILRSIAFDIFIISNVLIGTGHFIPFTFLPIHSSYHGYSKQSSAILVSIVGLGSIICRIFFGWFGDKQIINRNLLYTSMGFTSGVAMFSLTFTSRYYQFVVGSIGFVIGSAGYVAMSPAIIVDILGITRVAKGTGVFQMSCGLATFAAQIVGGSIYDMFNKPSPVFLTMGCTQLVGSALSIVAYVLLKVQRSKSVEDVQTVDVTKI